MKIIEILVTPEGKTTIQTKGFTGSFCREASSFIEQALGKRTGEQLTAEFHADTSLEQTARIQA